MLGGTTLMAAMVAVLLQGVNLEAEATRLTRQNGVPSLPVRFGERQLVGQLDTGASHVVLRSVEMNRELHGRVPSTKAKVRTFGGVVSEDLYGPSAISFAGVAEVAATFSIADGTQSAESGGMPTTWLILGQNALEAAVLRVDIRKGMVVAGERIPPGDQTCGLAGSPTPQVSVNLPNGNKRLLYLDTGGDGYVSLKLSLIQRLAESGDAQFLEERSMLTPKGVIRIQLYVVRSIEFAGVRFENVPVFVSEIETIGMGLLSHFDFTLDYPNQRAKFTPLDLERDRMPLDASGLRVVFRENGDFVIRRLVPGYPAEKAGFKVGDRITDFNGRNPETLWRHEIEETLSRSGETIQLTIERDGVEMKIPLTLQYPFVYPPVWEDPAKLFNPESN